MDTFLSLELDGAVLQKLTRWSDLDAGTLPASWTALNKSLTYLNVTQNRLTGNPPYPLVYGE
jgi:hypothetical protein